MLQLRDSLLQSRIRSTCLFLSRYHLCHIGWKVCIISSSNKMLNVVSLRSKMPPKDRLVFLSRFQNSSIFNYHLCSFTLLRLISFRSIFGTFLLIICRGIHIFNVTNSIFYFYTAFMPVVVVDSGMHSPISLGSFSYLVEWGLRFASHKCNNNIINFMISSILNCC